MTHTMKGSKFRSQIKSMMLEVIVVNRSQRMVEVWTVSRTCMCPEGLQTKRRENMSIK